MSYAFKRGDAWYVGFNDARGRKVQARAISCTTREQAEDLAVELSIQAKNAAPDELEDAAVTVDPVRRELLEALKGLLEDIDAREERPDCWCTDSGNGESGRPDIICAACHARAVIAKAEDTR